MKFRDKPGYCLEAMQHDFDLVDDIMRLIVNFECDIFPSNSEKSKQAARDCQLLRITKKRLQALGTYYVKHPTENDYQFARASEIEYIVYRDATFWESFKASFFGAISLSSYYSKGFRTLTSQTQDWTDVQKLYDLRDRLRAQACELEAEDVDYLAARIMACGANVFEGENGPYLRWANGMTRVLTKGERFRYKLFGAVPSEMYAFADRKEFGFREKAMEEKND